jgi:hypothetical protein
MAKYTEHFHIEPRELDLIEHALRREISSISAHPQNAQNQRRVRDVNALLGKIFNQKKFYAQVNDTGVPAG